MKAETQIILEDYSQKFNDYKNYIDGNNWSIDGDLDGYDLEHTIVSDIVTNLNHFKSEIGEDINSKKVSSFFKKSIKIINLHVDRVEKYLKEYNWSTFYKPLMEKTKRDIETLENEPQLSKNAIKEISNLKSHLNYLKEELKKDMVNQSSIFTKTNKIKVNTSKLNIDEEGELGVKKSLNIFFKNQKATLFLREFLCEHVPIVKDRVDSLDIDFNAPSINPATSNEFLINMKESDIPPYDKSKHFFEQELSTIQFWEEERRKISNGLNVGGYFIHPWLYFHLNAFKIANAEDISSKPTHPDFRDNEYFFAEMIKLAEEDGRKAVMMYGSRRIAKSTTMSSYVLQKLFTILNAQCTVQGFVKTPDLDAIEKYINVAVTNMHPALNINANNLDFDSGVVLGLKETQQVRLDYSTLTFVNLEGGTKKSATQKTAGTTPNGFLFDEIGKGACIKPWRAATPSFVKKDGNWRTVPLLSGTAGESSVSKDAEKMLKNPEDYDILPMNWDLLENFVDPEWVTWNKDQKFAFFVPAQLSLEAGLKDEKSFAEFLSLPESNPLEKIKIHSTNWEMASTKFRNRREAKKSDIDSLATESNSFPITPEDCYLTTEINKFPGVKAKIRKDFVEQEGIGGVGVVLTKNTVSDTIVVNFTDKPVITEYPYEGGNIDAPIEMLEILEEGYVPPLGLYTIGFDDVKYDKSDGDSVISATVFKRGYEGGEWANRIVAWYDSRPEKKEYYKQLFLLMRYYNARLLAENADNGFIEFLEDLDLRNGTNYVMTHISEGVGLASEDNLHRNKNRKYGWAPTGHNIYNLELKIVMYTKADGLVLGDMDDLEGIDMINHPMLLEELYKYKKDKNADRIRSFGLALTLAQYYDKTYQYMKPTRMIRREDGNKKNKKVHVTKNGFAYIKGIK